MKIACVQMDVAFADKAKNQRAISERVAEAARHGATLVVFPECALTGYCFESCDEALPLAETIPGEATQALAKACAIHGAHAVVGLIERAGDQLYNACVLVGPRGLVGKYRKIHLPGLGLDRLVTPGDERWKVYDVGSAKLGMHICYDSAFPESARSMALDGAELLVLPTNFPPGAECLCDKVLPARAMENCVYIAAANRVGVERGFQFIGGSKICGPDGELLAHAAHAEETIIYADLDLARARSKRRVRVPGKHEIDRFADRRPEMYARIVERNDNRKSAN
jgi:predicted amidohydrolase